MRTGISIAVVTLLLMLLSGLSLLGMNPEASRYDRLIDILSRFAITESALRQDILNVRAGLLRSYDPLNQEVQTLHTLLRQLRQEGADPAVVAPMEGMIGTQDKLVEEFKTDNALLQNSLAYFGVLCGRFAAAVKDTTLASAMTGLSTAMLRLTLDTSADATAEVKNQLDHFAEMAQANGQTELVTGILVHGRLLQQILPATDGLLETLYDLPRSQRLEALRTSVLAHQKASRAQARYYRGLLYATSILLLGLLVYFGMQLRLYLRALRRQAALERAIAAISMGFVNAPTEAIGQRVDAALATLAERVGADRAYFVVASDPLQTRGWCRDGGAWPPGWPAAAPVLTHRAADQEGMVYLPSVENMPDGPDKTLLHNCGLLGWMCASAYGLDANRGVLGFDFVRNGITRAPSDRGLLRMAADTIANAIGHAALEHDRARLESSLQQVRRMETVGAMASGVAHNFNNIIGVILGYTEMEEYYAESDSRLARNLEGIRHAAERARDLIDKILTFGRRKELPRKIVAMRSLITETQSLLSVSFPRRARLVVMPISGRSQCPGRPDPVAAGDHEPVQQRGSGHGRRRCGQGRDRHTDDRGSPVHDPRQSATRSLRPYRRPGYRPRHRAPGARPPVRTILHHPLRRQWARSCDGAGDRAQPRRGHQRLEPPWRRHHFHRLDTSARG